MMVRLGAIAILVMGSLLTMAPRVLAADELTVLVTGSNRGMGLEFARQFAAKGWTVIATCRDPSSADDLNDLAEKASNVIGRKA